MPLPFLFAVSVIVTQENYTDFLSANEGKPIFYKIWATWCPHCKQIAPIWENLSEIEEYQGTVVFAEIEQEGNRDLAKKFPGEATPRFFWSPGDRVELRPYSDPNTIEHFRHFIQKQKSYPLMTVDDDELKEQIKTTNISSVFLFEMPEDDKELLEMARSTAVAINDTGNMFLIQTKPQRKLTAYVGRDIEIEYKGEFTTEKLLEFAYLHSLPLGNQLTYFSLEFLMDHNLPAFLIATYGNYSYDFEAFKELSNQLPVLSLNCSSYGRWFCRYMAIKPEPITYAILNWSRREYYICNEPEDHCAWTNSVLSGLEKPLGPGIGRFSELLYPYYEHRARGKKGIPAVYWVVPIVVLVAIFLLVCDQHLGDKLNGMRLKKD